MIKLHKVFSETVNAITHPAPHHADEVFATAMLAVLFPVELFRTRDQNIIDSAEAVIYDVGSEFNPEKKRFDHHQKSFSEARPDGISYSSAGLIWREYGAEIVKQLSEKELDDEMVAKIVSRVDEALVRGIDARDNGQGDDGDSMSASTIVSNFNVLWDEDGDPSEGFLEACKFAGVILRREIRVAESSFCGQRLINSEIEAADGPILVMDRFVGGWLEAVLELSDSNPKAANLLYAVFPTPSGEWGVKAVPPDADRLQEQRKPFPEGWRGLKNADLIKNSGVESAIFCHKAGFFATAKTKDSAVELARRAVSS